LKPTLPSRAIIAGRVKASDRKITSGWRPRTSAPSLRWPSQISTADRATGRPINALAAKRPSSTAGVTASMAILGEASACSTDARSAIDHGSPVDADAALAEAHPHPAALLSDEYRLRVHAPLRSRTFSPDAEPGVSACQS